MNSRDTFVRQIELKATSTSCTNGFNEVLLNIHQEFVGCVVWDAALVLLKYLFTQTGNQYINGKRVLELGSGTGAVGLSSIVAGAANVIITDLPEHLALLKINIEENMPALIKCQSYNSNCIARASVLRWGNENDLVQAVCEKQLGKKKEDEILSTIDCILIADCIYYQEGMNKLYETIDCIMKRAASDLKVLCCYEYRENKQELINSFIRLIKANPILQLSCINHDDMDQEFCSDDISILLIRKRNFI